MLAEEYREISGISFSELKKIRNSVKNDLLIIGGWAAYFLSNKRFREWKKIDYIGSKDIGFGIKSENLETISRKLEKIGYTPLNFRFYKIFDREKKKPISGESAGKKSIFEIFYLYVDLILDKHTKTKTAFFSDAILEFCFSNNLWTKKNGFKVINPEPLVLMKLRALKSRNEEKSIKDILDCLFVVNFSDFDLNLFQEITHIFKAENVKTALSIMNSAQLELELGGLRLDLGEIRNIKTSFLSLLK